MVAPDHTDGLSVVRQLRVQDEILAEIDRARHLHGPMHSPHEGWAVIQEELEELWELVKADQGTTPAARLEAVQVAAMAVRYVTDLLP
jgi:hypothetical protein